MNEPDEGRYSEISREMAVSGDWLVPRLNGVPHWAKPPWIYWCVAASQKVFGFNEWASRFPAALAAAVAVFLTFGLGRRMAGELAGLLSALILTSALLFFGVGRLITPDMMLTACITAALYCFWRWSGLIQDLDGEGSRFNGSAVQGSEGEVHGSRLVSRGGWWMAGFYCLLGIAFLDKGPVGLAVCGLTVLGWALLTRRWSVLWRCGWWWGIPLVFAIGLPWFIIVASRNPELWDFYLVGEIKDRVVSGRGRTKEFWYFLAVFPLACLPWTALMASAARRHFQWWRTKAHGHEAAAFLMAWFFFPFLMYNLSGSKLPTYILPLVVPCSLMAGIWLAWLVGEKTGRAPAWSFILTGLFLPLPFVGVQYFALMRQMGRLDWLLPEWRFFLVGASGALAVGCLIAWFLLRYREGRGILTAFTAWWLAAVASQQLFLLHMDRMETSLGHNSSWRDVTRGLDGLDVVGCPITLALHPDGEKPRFARPGPRVAMYDHYFRSCSFYVLRGKNEYVPSYGADSLWELARDREREAKPQRDDLVELLKGPETVYVFTRPEAREELRGLTGLELPVLKSAASGKFKIVLFSNRVMK